MNFFRLKNRVIINIALIEDVREDSSGRWRVCMQSGKEHIVDREEVEMIIGKMKIDGFA